MYQVHDVNLYIVNFITHNIENFITAATTLLQTPFFANGNLKFQKGGRLRIASMMLFYKSSAYFHSLEDFLHQSPPHFEFLSLECSLLYPLVSPKHSVQSIRILRKIFPLSAHKNLTVLIHVLNF